MRTFALVGAAALAVSMSISSLVWAWTAEQPASQGANGANLADPLTSEETLKALQDKVSGGKDSSTNFFISAGPPEQSTGFSGFRAAPPGQAPMFGYSPNPGFRGQ